MREKSSFITSIPYSFTLIMPITSDNEILTVIEPRVFTERTVAVSFPARYIEKGEDPYEAL